MLRIYKKTSHTIYPEPETSTPLPLNPLQEKQVLFCSIGLVKLISVWTWVLGFRAVKKHLVLNCLVLIWVTSDVMDWGAVLLGVALASDHVIMSMSHVDESAKRLQFVT